MTATPPDLDAFRHAFRRHAAGVAIVTALRTDATPVGFTATSLASLAAVPPLATFNMARSASAWPAISETEYVIIHVCGARNRPVAETMAADNSARFLGEHWAPGPRGIPLIRDVPAWMLARIVQRIPVHNNAVVVVQVEEGSLGRADDALLYHERTFRTPGEPV